MQRSLNGFIPNGFISNNVATFYQSSPPTTRVGGAALVAGDRWWNTTNNVDCFWNGTYWLGVTEQKTSINSAGFTWTATALSANTFVTRSQIILPTRIFLQSITSKVTCLGSVSNVNNYSFQAVLLDPSASTASGYQLDVIDLFATSGTQGSIFTVSKTTQLNTLVNLSYEVALAIRITKTGSPGNCCGFFDLTWRMIYS